MSVVDVRAVPTDPADRCDQIDHRRLDPSQRITECGPISTLIRTPKYSGDSVVIAHMFDHNQVFLPCEPETSND